MKNYIDSSDVKKRMRILKEQADCSQITSTKICFNLYETANRTKNISDIVAFYKECGEGAYNADAYLDRCIGLLEEANDTRVLSAFQDFVLPIVTRPALAEAYSSQFSNYSDTTRKLLKTQYDFDLAMEQVFAFHDAILSNGTDLVEFASDTKVTDDMLIMECCAQVDNNFPNLPQSSKAIASVNESLYVCQEVGRQVKSLIVVMEVIDYYFQTFRDENNDFNNFMDGLDRDPICRGYYKEGFNVPEHVGDLKKDLQREYDKSSKLVIACRKFEHSEDKDIASLNALFVTVFRSSNADIETNFGEFLHTLFYTAVNSNGDISKYICNKIAGDILLKIQEKTNIDTESPKEFIMKIMSHIDSVIKTADILLQNREYSSKAENAVYFKNSMKELRDALNDSFDYILPTYAAECAFNDFVSEKDNDINSVRDFKVFKFDNIVTRCYKIDKYLQKQFNGFKQNVKKHIDNINQKIFEEASVYEMLTDEGNLDYCVTSFDISTVGDFSEYHEFCTSCIRYINTEILSESGMICYYQLNPDTLEFRIKENLNIRLSDNDKLLIEQNLSVEDLNRIGAILEAAEVYPDFDFINESTRFFKKFPESDLFNTYLEAASMVGVPRDTITEVYEELKESNGTSFVVGTSYNVSQYIPLRCDIETVLESVNALELILEADKPMSDRQKAAQARKAAQLAQWEKEEEEEEARKNGVKKSSTTKNVDKTQDKKVDPKKDKKPISNNPKVNAVADKVGEGADKLKKFMTSMKLYVHAIKGKMKNLDAKAQTAVRNMDDTIGRLAKGIKQALVSDRREAIIKGSVIPSFHKCLLIAAAEAGLWAINPPIAIIAAVGGFAASKKLTKKERALLYDDIMIEIKIMDKEIQRADEKNQIKKLRQLMRMRKELERQAARIKYNIRIGRDFVPSGNYINRDED